MTDVLVSWKGEQDYQKITKQLQNELNDVNMNGAIVDHLKLTAYALEALKVADIYPMTIHRAINRLGELKNTKVSRLEKEIVELKKKVVFLEECQRLRNGSVISDIEDWSDVKKVVVEFEKGE